MLSSVFPLKKKKKKERLIPDTLLDDNLDDVDVFIADMSVSIYRRKHPPGFLTPV